MAKVYQGLCEELKLKPLNWLVTGAAGFIGSHLVEQLLGLNQKVTGLDNLSTGREINLETLKTLCGESYKNFNFIRADITDRAACDRACHGVNIVLHQAALGSVPRSIKDPISSNAANVDGFLNMILAAEEAKVSRFVYASSSSVYGDSPELPKVEERVGTPLSPYAVSKKANELYAEAIARCRGFHSIGLRYFNVFGARQNPAGPYAAVVPIWIDQLISGQETVIYGDGETSRDFCYVANVVQANILAGCTKNSEALDKVYNVAYGDRTDLRELHSLIRQGLEMEGIKIKFPLPRHEDFRVGDVKHSLADISRARNLLGYDPTHSLKQGMSDTVRAYLRERG